MKTPDEIKIWLDGCKDKSGCQLCYNDWVCKENAYALAYIRQLEADNSRKDDTIRNLTELLNAAHEETARVKRERDAAVKDILILVGNENLCSICKHSGENNKAKRQYCKAVSCDDCKIYECACMDCSRHNCYEWRGVCPENTEGDIEK